MTEEVQDNIEVQPIDEPSPAPPLPDEEPAVIEAPKPKRGPKLNHWLERKHRRHHIQ